MNKLKQILQSVQKPIKWFRKIRTKNKIVVIVAILIVIFFIFKRVQSANAKPQYLTQAVEKATISQIVSETGNIATTNRSDVYSSSTGIIEKIYVEDGASVKVNQNLFQIRSTATDQEKAAAFATYQSAASAYQQALNNRRNTQALVDNIHDQLKDHSSDENFSEKATRTSFEVANDNASDTLKTAEASLKSAEFIYRTTQSVTVKAPSSGTIANLAYEIGDKVIANGGTVLSTSSTPVLIIVDLNSYTVKLALNEVDVPKVKNGDSAQLNLDAFPGKTFNGQVIHVDSIGTNTLGVITYNIVIKITDPEDSIRPAMTANVDIEVDKAENVLTVPNSAIKPYEGKKAVQVIDPKTKTTKYIPVEIGIKSPERTEIKSGLDEGTQIITGTKNGAVKSTSSSPLGG